LHGDRQGQWALSVSGAWRLCFRFQDGHVFDLELVQYHLTMIPRNRRPTPPGEILFHEFIEPLGRTQKQLADALGVTRIRINEIIRGRRGVTPDPRIIPDHAVSPLCCGVETAAWGIPGGLNPGISLRADELNFFILQESARVAIVEMQGLRQFILEVKKISKFTAIIEKCAETGLYVGYVPGFPGAHSQGETLDELNRNLQEVLNMLLEDGEPPLEAEFVGTQVVMVG
jgi:predicted RNase H-like HicB family nuclease/DNA-binding XRE family transcriptional regulator